MKKAFIVFLFLGLFSLVITDDSLLAQSTGLSGFDLHLFRPPADGSGILNLHGSEILEPWKFRLGMVSEASHGLLAATNPVTGQSIRVVNDLVTSNFQGAVGITNFFQAGLNVPVVLFEQGTNFNTAQGFRTASIGDISLDLKFRVLKDQGARPGIALVSVTTFPSGSTGKFTGGSNVTEEARLVIDKKIGPVSLLANGGYRVMKRTQVANLDIDDMVTFGGGAAWTLPFGGRNLDLVAEVDGSTVIRNPTELTSPLEWLVGFRQKVFEGLTVEMAGGRGITNSIAGGDWRLIAGVHFRSASREAATREPVLLETVYFRFNRDRYRPKYEPRLERVAEKIKGEAHSKVKLRGHTDSEGTEAYNLDLSRRRAERVARFLIRQGVPQERMTIESLGYKEPVSENRTAKGKAQNRRVEILKVPAP